MVRTVSISAAALAALALAGGASLPAARPLSPKATHVWNVGAGTTGILVEDHRAPLVEIRLVFPVGKWSAWHRKTPYLDEAMAMQLKDPGGVLRARADRLGVDVGFSTDARQSVVTLGCRKTDVDSALALARDLLANRDLDRHEIKRRNTEKDLEWSAAQKNPQAVLRRTVRRLLFAPDDPRRRPYEKPDKAPGDPRRLVAERDRMIRLPGRSIGLAGDLTPAEAERLAATLLPPIGSNPGTLEPALSPPLPPEKRPREEKVRMSRLTQVYLALAREAPPVTDDDFPALLLADHVLGGHFYSRLYKALRHGSGDTYATGTIRELEPAAGAYAAWTYSRTANAPQTEARLREVVRVFHERGITEEERADAAGFLTGRRAFNVQSPGQVLDRIVWDRSRGLEAGYRDRLVERAAALSLGEINDFIRRFYDPAKFTMVRVEPK
jgi:zinc protease